MHIHTVARTVGDLFDFSIHFISFLFIFLTLLLFLLLYTFYFCRDNTSKDPFSQCEQLQGICIQVNSEYVGTLMTTEMMTRMRRATSTTTCLIVDANLKHVNTQEYTI